MKVNVSVNERFGDVIRYLIYINKHKSQNRIAYELHLSAQQLSNRINAKHAITENNIIILFVKFRVNPFYILLGLPPMIVDDDNVLKNYLHNHNISPDIRKYIPDTSIGSIAADQEENYNSK